MPSASNSAIPTVWLALALIMKNTQKRGGRMIELTIKVSPEVIDGLKSLQDRVNKNLAPAIEEGIEHLVNIHRIAAALVKIGLSDSSRSEIRFKRDKITFAVMVAQQQLREEG